MITGAVPPGGRQAYRWDRSRWRGNSAGRSRRRWGARTTFSGDILSPFDEWDSRSCRRVNREPHAQIGPVIRPHASDRAFGRRIEDDLCGIVPLGFRKRLFPCGHAEAVPRLEVTVGENLDGPHLFGECFRSGSGFRESQNRRGRDSPERRGVVLISALGVHDAARDEIFDVALRHMRKRLDIGRDCARSSMSRHRSHPERRRNLEGWRVPCHVI